VKETGEPSIKEASAGYIRGAFPPCLGWLPSEANGRLPTYPVGLSNESPNLLPFSFLVHSFSSIIIPPFCFSKVNYQFQTVKRVDVLNPLPKRFQSLWYHIIPDKNKNEPHTPLWGATTVSVLSTFVTIRRFFLLLSTP
jgi:hypothetical protein